MDWIRWHENKDGTSTAHIQWRDDKGRVRSNAAGSDERLVAMWLD